MHTTQSPSPVENYLLVMESTQQPKTDAARPPIERFHEPSNDGFWGQLDCGGVVISRRKKGDQESWAARSLEEIMPT